MFEAVLICSDSDCPERVEEIGTLEELEALACDCGCGLLIVSLSESESVCAPSPQTAIFARRVELARAA